MGLVAHRRLRPPEPNAQLSRVAVVDGEIRKLD
jgi:hypothetical protein